MKFVVIGLSVTSSWGNGHATTYRALLKELANADHEILFLENDVPYYASNRDLPNPGFCTLGLYNSNEELFCNYEKEVANADVVIVGSYVQEGVEVGKWVVNTAQGIKAFYDIDTPVTLAKLEREDYEYITPYLIKKYDLYLSFSGGPILDHIERYYGSPAARALYCSVDTEQYYPEKCDKNWELGYLGTFSTDRQPTVEMLLCNTAKQYPNGKFVVAGPQYPTHICWPENVQRIEHLPPAQHREFYNSQKFTLNVTRADMIRAGYSPSVRLFEAAACGVPIISDYWEGLTSLFNEDEIIIARTTDNVLSAIASFTEEQRRLMGSKAREKVLQHHTAQARAKELLHYVAEAQKALNTVGQEVTNGQI
jgi:spore maturation protein CgeB